MAGPLSTLLRWLAALSLILLSAAAQAHLAPNSEIGLAIGRSHIEAKITIPLGELQFADPVLADRRPGAEGAAARRRIGAYLLAHLGADSPDGRAWGVTLADAHIGRAAPPDLEAVMILTPPAGASARRFTLRYDAVMDRVPSHFALVYLRHDFDGGYLSDRRRLLGGLRQHSPTLAIDMGTSDAWSGFGAAVALGMHHIAEGHDHLLFLIVLLLAAPLRARARHWGGYAGWRHTARSLIGVVTAFTVGHSLTLIGGALFDWRLPSQPVEILIALSILISAVHAWRPLFAGREAVVAGGFGLVHGLAFATLIGHLGLDRWQQALSILGFNIGIELVQLLVVASVMPGLVLLAGTRFYPPVRNAMAAFAALAALCWIVERASGTVFAPAQAIDALLDRAPYALATMILLGAAVLLVRRISGASRTS